MRGSDRADVVTRSESGADNWVGATRREVARRSDGERKGEKNSCRRTGRFEIKIDVPVIGVNLNSRGTLLLLWSRERRASAGGRGGGAEIGGVAVRVCRSLGPRGTCSPSGTRNPTHERHFSSSSGQLAPDRPGHHAHAAGAKCDVVQPAATAPPPTTRHHFRPGAQHLAAVGRRPRRSVGFK